MIEYALLALFIGIVGFAAMQAMAGNMEDAYTDGNHAVQDLWVVPDPAGS